MGSESQLVQWELIKRGVGIGVMIPEVGDSESGVRRLWPSLPPLVFPMWLVVHRELRESRRVRAVFEFAGRATRCMSAFQLGSSRSGARPVTGCGAGLGFDFS